MVSVPFVLTTPTDKYLEDKAELKDEPDMPGPGVSVSFDRWPPTGSSILCSVYSCLPIAAAAAAAAALVGSDSPVQSLSDAWAKECSAFPTGMLMFGRRQVHTPQLAQLACTPASRQAAHTRVHTESGCCAHVRSVLAPLGTGSFGLDYQISACSLCRRDI